jgi:hypothetical protein
LFAQNLEEEILHGCSVIGPKKLSQITEIYSCSKIIAGSREFLQRIGGKVVYNAIPNIDFEMVENSMLKFA